MDSDSAQVASIIHSNTDRILDIWRAEVRVFLGYELDQTLLDNRLLSLLEVLAKALGGAEESREEESARATDYGLQRAEQGFDTSQITREFHVLRRAVHKICAETGTPLSEEARGIVDAIIDTATVIGVARCAQKREETIKEESARKLSFAVHDFRTPLGAIALAAAEIAVAIPPQNQTPDLMESLASLERNVERLSVEMETTMREFASVFSGAGETRIRQFSLYPLVADVIDELASQAQCKNLTLSNDVDPEAEVAAAPGSLRRILTNLIGNALRHTRIGGISISSLSRETEVDIMVKDTGIGIVDERLASIFEPGTKEQSSPGMGFGLAIAKYLAELNSGRIGIESTVGKGTVVTVTLPITIPPKA